MRFLLISLIFYAIQFHLTIPVSAQSPLAKADLDSLVKEALLNNPEIRAARYQSQASWSRVRQVVSWEPPQVGVEFYQTPAASFPNPLKDQMETDYFIEQMIHFPGKLGAMGKAARFSAHMTEEEARVVERRVIRELKSAYSELYFIHRKITLNAENQQLMRQLADIASRQYEAGMGGQTDILRAQTELSKLTNEGIALERERLSMEAMINMLLNRPLGGSIGRIDSLAIDFPEWTLEKIDSLALVSRPGLQAMRFEVEMNKAEVNASRWDYAPDFMTRLMYKDMAMTPKDYWSFMIEINLPLTSWAYSKATARVDEMRAQTRKSEASTVQMKNMVLLDVQNAWLSLQTNRNLIELNWKAVLPQSRMALESAIAGYRTGKVMFVMVIDAYRMALMARLDIHMAIMNAAVSLAALEEAVGLSVEDIKARIR
jgi:cobalt-zinc-cadmium efflux system outer membrane protein